ncbi:MAG: type II secretion system protein [Deltaproteobacteria bacterium]|nr:type II secretion system protein [Deltaproteobacteria bacterium]
MDSRPLKNGFTLVELVLVIALLGLFAVGVVTMTFNFKRSHLQVAAEKVRTDIEQARSLAMTKKGTTFGVFFNDSTDQYTVYQTAVTTPVADPLTKQNLIETFSKWSGVTLTGGNYTVEFNSLGSPTTGGGGSVQITDGTNTKTIIVTAVTGHVTVQ